MKRRGALKTLIVGGFAAAMVHPRSRHKIIKTGARGFELYKNTMFKLSEKKSLSEKESLVLTRKFLATDGPSNYRMMEG